MNFKKKAVLFAAVVAMALLFALPITRDELAWYWTATQNESSDYMSYMTDWPKGRHLGEAKLRYEQRTWTNTKRGMINEAIKKNSAAQSDPEARKQRQARREQFFWKQVTNQNTIFGYKDYLQRYPAGEYASEARQKAAELESQNPDPNSQH